MLFYWRMDKKIMKNDNSFLENFAKNLEEPEDFFKGRCLPAGFALPDNILMFFHDYTLPMPNSHGRHTLVIPLDRMTYFVERKKIELSPGLILYIPPYAVRFLHPDSPGYRRLFITFDTKGVQPYLPQMGAYELRKNYGILRSFLDKYKTGPMAETSIALMNFLSEQKSVRSGISTESKLPKKIVDVISRIETQISEVYCIKSLSDSVDISESRLRALFRQYMGISIGRFIAEKKMDYARYSLLNSHMPVADIARNSGFANVYVFSAFFKRNAGVSPLHFRQNNQLHEGI